MLSTTRKQRSAVCKSGITPCKHFLLNRLLGREVGVISRGYPPVTSVFFYDLTAGDGVPYLSADDGFTSSCSPGIFLRHTHWLTTKQRFNKPLYLIGCEKQAVTYNELVKNTAAFLDANDWAQIERGYYARNTSEVAYIHTNASDINAPVSRDSSCFIYNDPNHIEDWSLTPEFLNNCPRFTTSLSTLGCNVGGLKRIDESRRREWFARVETVCASVVKGWHDACLFSVGGADQWAYLITAPAKWRDEITDECTKAAKKLEKKITAEPQIVWRKRDPESFYQLQRFLFLTREEFNRGVNF